MPLSPSPVAITMWDFSWLERRWPGAGYEDWDLALDELVERGYNAVRIDAYPHLVAVDPGRTWTLLPVWDQQDWGSPALTRVVIQPQLNQFIRKCRDRGIRVGLSTWFREDMDRTRLGITTASKHAEIWLKTLATIAADGLLDAILYVDLCNEWPGDLWAPFFKNNPPEATWGAWYTETSLAWMLETVVSIRSVHPDLPLCYSFDSMDDRLYHNHDLSMFDLLEHHTWMVKENGGEFYKSIYNYERFSSVGYANLVEHAERRYRERPEYWQKLLTDRVASLAAASRAAKIPLATTECWGIVDYKDWPLLPWDWVKELCALGATSAARSGRWLAIATSNFCGPQFVGMWRDKAWHQALTRQIRETPIDPALLASGDQRFLKRLQAPPR